jgi:hypothetical protein
VPAQGEFFFFRFEVPHLDRAIFAAGIETLAVAAHRQACGMTV